MRSPESTMSRTARWTCSVALVARVFAILSVREYEVEPMRRDWETLSLISRGGQGREGRYGAVVQVGDKRLRAISAPREKRRRAGGVACPAELIMRQSRESARIEPPIQITSSSGWALYQAVHTPRSRQNTGQNPGPLHACSRSGPSDIFYPNLTKIIGKNSTETADSGWVNHLSG